MAYLALYRKYRPATLRQVVGQTAATTALRNAVKDQKTTHAYVFTGPAGTGKTSLARIMAKALNCLNLKDGDCCNVCANCLLINKEETPDVLEIDAASNNSVDDARSLIETVYYPPVALKKKMYIIDEAHALTTQAWNALLKTLEEPPEHAVFVFATTEPQKIPLTILSRSQRYDMQRLKSSTIVELLAGIAKSEGFTVEEGVLAEIAYLSGGGARDAIGILDQLSLVSGRHITETSLRESFNIAGRKEIVALLTSVAKGDEGSAIKLMDELYTRAVGIGSIANETLSALVELRVHGEGDAGDFVYVDDATIGELSPLKEKAPLLAQEAMSFLNFLRGSSARLNHYRLFALRLLAAFKGQAMPVVSTVATPPVSVPSSSPTPAKKTSVTSQPAPKAALKNALTEIYDIPLVPPSVADGKPVQSASKEEKTPPKPPVVPHQSPTRPSVNIPFDDLVIAAMYLNDDKLKAELSKKLDNVDDYLVTHAKETTLYRGAKILVACPGAIVLLFGSESVAALFNNDVVKVANSLFVKTLFGRDYKMAGLTKEKAKVLSERARVFIEGNGKPQFADELSRPVVDDRGGKAIAFAKSIFGDDIKVVD